LKTVDLLDRTCNKDAYATLSWKPWIYLTELVIKTPTLR